MIARRKVGGKSGQCRARQLLTATKSNLRESATETIPPRSRSPLMFAKQLFVIANISGGLLRGKGEMSGVRAHSLLW